LQALKFSPVVDSEYNQKVSNDYFPLLSSSHSACFKQQNIHTTLITLKKEKEKENVVTFSSLQISVE